MALLSAKRAKKAPAEDTESSDEHQSNASDTETADGNSGWANSMLKVLKTTQNSAVLSRAKKIDTKKGKKGDAKKKDYDFEIEGDKVKQEEKDEVKPEASALDAQLTRQQRKNVPLQLRVKPSFRDMERERSLRKVATRGAVQFFNAVRIQQKEIKQQLAEAGPLDSRQDAVLNNIDKRKFLDVLMSGKRAKSATIDNPVKKEESPSEGDSDEPTDDEAPGTTGSKKKSEWNVLREDFMTNKKIKHWDEEDDEEAEENKDSNEESSEGDED
ncbi:CG3817 [Drosophila busckii]|uniref:RRP15-like protein n=1 Tax=Drosophila busckii TaxID=30019 RepID=A0A0M4ESS5_DROBS|nr:RRP15-like protein [Drosophila busckii]ALC45730.1 CG3817 [Drosophila busckii]